MLMFLDDPSKYTSHPALSMKAAVQGHQDWRSERRKTHANLLPSYLLRSKLQGT